MRQHDRFNTKTMIKNQFITKNATNSPNLMIFCHFMNILFLIFCHTIQKLYSEFSHYCYYKLFYSK